MNSKTSHKNKEQSYFSPYFHSYFLFQPNRRKSIIRDYAFLRENKILISLQLFITQSELNIAYGFPVIPTEFTSNMLSLLIGGGSCMGVINFLFYKV